MKQNFIRTSDKETADILISLGFQQISDGSSGYYTFLNNITANFDEASVPTSKLQYTNMLCI